MRKSRFWAIYMTLVVFRLFVALQRSYLHPDEFLQSAEPLVGDIFGRQIIRTWEFSSDRPIRSIFPIWLFEAPGLYLLKTLTDVPSSASIFYVLRLQQFLWTLILDILVFQASNSQTSALLWASSYTTMAMQTHTFSNSWESVLVLACLVTSQNVASVALLPVLAAIGLFARPSFCFFMVPVVWHLLKNCFLYNPSKQKWEPREEGFQIIAFSCIMFSIVVALLVYIDTIYYTGHWLTIYTWDQAVFTVWNNIRYNVNPANLAMHGTHPRYQHILNFVLLIGPGAFLPGSMSRNLYTASMLTGFFGLSIIPHQEPRFLLPCIVLFCVSIKMRTKLSKTLWYLWLFFNLIGTVFFGVIHQGGVIPVSIHIAEHYPAASITYTKCYPAPRMLLNEANVVKHILGSAVFEDVGSVKSDLLVMPISSTASARHKGLLDRYELIWQYSWHINLDDFDVLGLDVLYNHGLGLYQLQTK